MAKKSSFWSDFKSFISKGNVLDMAVGVVIGGAFGKIVTGLVNFIINPIIGLLTGGTSLDLLKTVIKPAAVVDGVEVAEVAILWGSWFQTILDFVIVALCIFCVLRAIMKAKNIVKNEKKAAEEKAKAEEEKKAAEEAAAALEAKKVAVEDATLRSEKLLEEIKELLAKK